MASAKDWIGDSVDEIVSTICEEPVSREDLKEIIKKHCPFEEGVAYVPYTEPPLLICISCRNTESCAGALARTWNKGKCMYCGGTFEVLRA